MTKKEIQNYKDKIDNMSQLEMARLWRLAPAGSVYFDASQPIYEYFQSKFKGFTPKISKTIGW